MPEDRIEPPFNSVPMRPFISFYGAKFRQSARLPGPRHPLIIEPFAGSLGYSVRHAAGRQVLGIERDPTIAGVWRWLLDATAADVRSLPLLAPDDDLRRMPEIDQRARHLMGFWVNGGVSAPRHRLSKWARQQDGARTYRPGTYWGAAVRDRIARQLPGIAEWDVIDDDYSTAPDVEATWFIDPPYQGTAGRHYRYGADGIDYTTLAEWCRARRGQVIVCEHVGADWLPFEAVRYAVQDARGGYSPEAVWTDA